MVILMKQKRITPYKALCYYSGTSNDIKPNGDSLSENSIFNELDTGKKYYFTGRSWDAIPQSGGGGGSGEDLDFAEGNDF